MIPTIKEALAAFDQQFQEARNQHLPSHPSHPTNPQLTTNHQAFSSNKTTGAITGPLLKFLSTPDLPPYFKMKIHLTLSGADEEDDAWENLAVCRHHLNAAEKVFAECKEVYTNAVDVQRLRMIKKLIEEERSALLEREKAT